MLASVLMGSLGGFAIYRGQVVPGVILALPVVFFVWLSRSIWTARVYADDVRVGRTMPWPKECRRSDLRLIRIKGAASPSWEFQLATGEVAFRVSPILFPVRDMKMFGQRIGVNVDDRGWDRS